VTRDVTAWACSGIEPILSASCSWAWARLGPLSTENQGTVPLHRRLDRNSVRCDRSPNRVAWRFPDWTAVGFRFRTILRSPRDLGSPRRPAPSRGETKRRIAHAPGPAPRGSVVLHIALPRCSDDVGPMRRIVARSLTSRFFASLAATLTRLAKQTLARLSSSGWPDIPSLRTDAVLTYLSLAADSRRARNWVASHGSTVAWESDSVSGAFSIFAGRFPARRRQEIYRHPHESPTKSTSSSNSYPPPLASSEICTS